MPARPSADTTPCAPPPQCTCAHIHTDMRALGQNTHAHTARTHSLAVLLPKLLPGEEEKERGSHQLDALTGCPRAEDILLFAVPVCAPYQVRFRIICVFH